MHWQTFIFSDYSKVLAYIIQVEDFGVDWTGPTSFNDDDEDAIVVPTTTCPISENDYSELKRRVDPLYACDDYGMSLCN